MPFGLRHVISGILAGDPWFPHGVVLLLSPVCMTLCVFVFLWLCLFSCVLAILGYDDTMLPSPALITNELGASHSCVSGFGLFRFCCLVLFVCLPVL